MGRIFSLILVALAFVAPAFAQQSLRPTERNIPYGSQERPDRLLDLYLPDDVSAPYPVVLMFHGSGGNKGDVSNMGIPQLLVPEGYAGVSATYTTRFGDNLEDAFCALAWVYANAEVYGFDGGRVALYGISFGGLTATTVAAVDDPSRFMDDCPNALPDDYELSGVLSQSGVFFASIDALFAEVSLGNEGSSAELAEIAELLLQTPSNAWRDLDLPEDVAEYLSAFPMYWVNGNEPPHFIVHGWADRVVPLDDALDYVDLLSQQRVNVAFVHDRLSGHVAPPRVFDEEMRVFLWRIFS